MIIGGCFKKDKVGWTLDLLLYPTYLWLINTKNQGSSLLVTGPIKANATRIRNNPIEL